jgi:hypothetical protein
MLLQFVDLIVHWHGAGKGCDTHIGEQLILFA